MCGIAGVFQSELEGAPLRLTLEALADAMRHRGPDDGAVRLIPEAASGLAARRLSLVDPERGAQPAANEDDSVFALLNGEIYNDQALREELQSQGHSFHTSCDTEVLPHLYEQYGEAFLDRVDGMFALAILDVRNRRLLLARDGPGMKPLYYASTSKGFAFASEAKALTEAGLIHAKPDLDALDVYLAVGYVPAPMTMFDGVGKLMPGERLIVDGAGRRSSFFSRYLFETDADAPRDLESATTELERRLDAAVRSHLRGDVEVGSYLSGGWDSSLTTFLAARHLGTRLKTFSIVFPGAGRLDEGPFSRTMAKFLGTDHFEVEFRADEVPDLYPKLVRSLDEPVASLPIAAIERVAHLASQRVKTVLTGQGSDELFGGYYWFRRKRPFVLQRIAPHALLRWAARRLPEGRARQLCRHAAAPTPAAADAEWQRALEPRQKTELLKPQYLGRNRPDIEPTCIPEDVEASCRGPLDRRMGNDLYGRLPGAILFCGDKLSMANSIEERVPFLDRHVVNFSRRLPQELKVQGDREKVVVGALARRLLPPEIADRKKFGLLEPRSARTGPPMDAFVRDTLLGDGVEGPLNHTTLERVVPLWLEGGQLDEQRLQRVMLLQLWWNEFMR